MSFDFEKMHFRALLIKLGSRQQSTGLVLFLSPLFKIVKTKMTRAIEFQRAKQRLKNLGIVFTQPSVMTPSQKV